MPLTYDRLLQEAHAFLARPGENQVGAQEALAPDLAGLPLFDPPLLGISAAHDPLYATLKAPEAIGPWFLSPEEWLPGAASVLSFFFPFSQAVIQSNRQTPDAPSPAGVGSGSGLASGGTGGFLAGPGGAVAHFGSVAGRKGGFVIFHVPEHSRAGQRRQEQTLAPEALLA